MAQIEITFDPPEDPDVAPPKMGDDMVWLPGVDLPVKMPQSHGPQPQRARRLKKVIDDIWELTHDRHAFDKACEMWLITLRRFESGADEREKRYLEIVGQWGRPAVQKVCEGLAILVDHFRDHGGFYDLLGQTYELCADDWGGQVLGQYFTPWPAARMMARQTMEGVKDPIDAGETVTVHDPACGSGVMLLAAKSVVAARCGRRSLRYLKCYGQDIDSICCTMARIQERMSNIPWLLNFYAATYSEAANKQKPT